METQVTAEAVFKELREIIGVQAQEIASLRAVINSQEKPTTNP